MIGLLAIVLTSSERVVCSKLEDRINILRITVYADVAFVVAKRQVRQRNMQQCNHRENQKRTLDYSTVRAVTVSYPPCYVNKLTGMNDTALRL